MSSSENKKNIYFLSSQSVAFILCNKKKFVIYKKSGDKSILILFSKESSNKVTKVIRYEFAK